MLHSPTPFPAATLAAAGRAHRFLASGCLRGGQALCAWYLDQHAGRVTACQAAHCHCDVD
jgi:hypothetical protein